MDGGYLLAALDMDGTLLNTKHETTLWTRAALSRAAEAGRVIALCTGRCLSELRDHLDVLPGVSYAICENGGCLYDARRKAVISQIVIPDGDAARIFEAVRGFDACVQGFIGGQSYMQLRDASEFAHWHIDDFAGVFEAGSAFVENVEKRWREGGKPVEKLNLYFTCLEDREAFARRLGEIDLNVADSLGIGYEISPRAATKGLGLMALCELLGIPVARSMAVGDGGNDLELMRAAGFSVAMGNATDAVRAEADALTEDNDHDGAAAAVLKWMGLSIA